MTLLLVAISLVLFAALAMRESPLWQWGAGFAAIGLLSGLEFTRTGALYELNWFSWVLIAFGVVLLVLSIKPIVPASNASCSVRLTLGSMDLTMP